MGAAAQACVKGAGPRPDDAVVTGCSSFIMHNGFNCPAAGLKVKRKKYQNKNL